MPDGQFVSWLGQATYVRRLGQVGSWFRPDRASVLGNSQFGDARLVLRGAWQAANRSLPEVEQFTVGGLNTVRGYRENQLVRDAGFAASAELQFCLIPGPANGLDQLSLILFQDTGYARNYRSPSPGASDHGENLNSVGVGLDWRPDPHVSLQVYYGYALTNRDTSRSDLQDIGVHFSLTITGP